MTASESLPQNRPALAPGDRPARLCAPDLETPAPALPDTDTPEERELLRRMPDAIRARLKRDNRNRLYLGAADRIVWFRDDHPQGRIHTIVESGSLEEGWCVCRATLWDNDGRELSTAIKTCRHKDFPAGFMEKSETGAIARALGFAGYGTAFMPELEEETDPATGEARPLADTPQSPPSSERRRSVRTETPRAAPPNARPLWNGPGQCPTCHCPAGATHATHCGR